jgi:glycosyltransferase involved in cell wall biosynthesis
MKNIRYFYEESPGLHVGRHKGLREAKTNIIVYADDDIEAFPTWLEAIKDTFEDEDVDLVGGKNLPKFESSPPFWLERLWQQNSYGRWLGYYSLIDFGESSFEIPPEFVWGCNYAIRKNVLIEAGGFHPDAMPWELIKFRGDGETAVSKAIIELGRKAVYNPRAGVYHYLPEARMTKEYLYRRAFAQGISNSFADVRAMRSENIQAERLCSSSSFGFKKTFQRLKEYVKAYTHKDNEMKEIFQILEKGQSDGYNFHLAEVKKDPELLRWVMKRNWLDNDDRKYCIQ